MYDGAVLIGGQPRQKVSRFRAIDPSRNEHLSGSFSEADDGDVAAACQLAAEAAPVVARLDLEHRARFLEAAAEAILAIGNLLITTAAAETGLTLARLTSERTRTVEQLRLFASEVRGGEWLDIVVESRQPQRVPPRPDLRRINVALGPVAVFGASNFPLAFSVAGGDSASSLAAGCPIVVKGHPAHPGTGELVARALCAAVANCGLPPGMFSYLPGSTHALGAALVGDPGITAVCFTGSRSGGLALLAAAQRRPVPIPVFAEMSSVNPVFLLPAALAERAEHLGGEFAASLSLGAGQFCTNPGLVVAVAGSNFDRFISAAASELSRTPPTTMLSSGIHEAFAARTASLDVVEGIDRVASGLLGTGPNQSPGAIFVTSAQQFMDSTDLADEVFGACSLFVRCRDMAELESVARSLEGQLTATLHLGIGDEGKAAQLMPILVGKAGRIVANGWPTGVEVARAMVHGGPFPACTHSTSSSVGTLAMRRFLRPICFQDIPQYLLPPSLQDLFIEP